MSHVTTDPWDMYEEYKTDVKIAEINKEGWISGVTIYRHITERDEVVLYNPATDQVEGLKDGEKYHLVSESPLLITDSAGDEVATIAPLKLCADDSSLHIVRFMRPSEAAKRLETMTAAYEREKARADKLAACLQMCNGPLPSFKSLVKNLKRKRNESDVVQQLVNWKPEQLEVAA